MKLLINLLISAFVVFILAHFLPGANVDTYGESIVIAIVLALLNMFVKPILSFIAIPLNILTLGLFSFVINAAIIMLCAYLVPGFQLDSFWDALLFSIILSIIQAITRFLTK